MLEVSHEGKRGQERKPQLKVKMWSYTLCMHDQPTLYIHFPHCTFDEQVRDYGTLAGVQFLC